MVSYLVAILIIIGIYALLTQALNLQYGFAGLINFGLVGFFAIGAYASALVTLATHSFLAGFTSAMLLPALAACPLALLAIRLRDDYLAIVTLGFGEIVRIVIVSEEWLTNGLRGLPGIPQPFTFLGRGLAETAYLGLVFICNILVLALLARLTRSPFGRLIEAIRDDELAATTLSKKPTVPKVQVFMVGAAVSGLAGALYGHYLSYLVPDQFVPLVTFYVWMAMILGGVGSLRGAFLGATVLVVLLEGSRFIRDLFPGIMEVQMASVRLALIGLVLVLFILFRPSGIMGSRTRP
jgi:branched-chain amino acid transport system permease protein